MTAIRPIETKTAEVAQNISKIIKGRISKYQYLRPDGQNIEDFVVADIKSAYQYIKESEPISTNITKKPGVGGIIDFYAG